MAIWPTLLETMECEAVASNPPLTLTLTLTLTLNPDPNPDHSRNPMNRAESDLYILGSEQA